MKNKKLMLGIIILIFLCIVVIDIIADIRLELIKYTIHSDLPDWLLEFLWRWL